MAEKKKMRNQEDEATGTKEKVEHLSLEELEERLAPAPVWAGGAFPGKGPEHAGDHADPLGNDNPDAAFNKFADDVDGDDDGDDDGDGTSPPATAAPTASPGSPPAPPGSPPAPPTI